MADTTHFVLIPSYNPGPLLAATVRDACLSWDPVWVVVDGSTDGSDQALGSFPVRLLRRRRNGGKGAAVLSGLRAALAEGFTHALVMDADGQHCAADIPSFMDASRAAPDALVLGQPVFGPDAPLARRLGRRVSNVLTRLEAAPARPGDGLFGFRVYPVAPLAAVMAATTTMRGFDFDPEAAVRLLWRGHPALHLSTPVRYPRGSSGGVSHFRYGRDNLRLLAMHIRLLATAFHNRVLIR